MRTQRLPKELKVHIAVMSVMALGSFLPKIKITPEKKSISLLDLAATRAKSEAILCGMSWTKEVGYRGCQLAPGQIDSLATNKMRPQK